MPLAKITDPLPEHPSIVRGPFLGRYRGNACMVAEVQCPRCKEVRIRTASEMRREVNRWNYKGLCRPCSFAAVREGTHRRKDANRKSISHSHGYLLTLLSEVTDDELPMYRSMQKSGQPVFAHRWAMAKALGRPLQSNECVDHMNGDKHDNRVENLRIYLKGKQMPGSTNGYGTYYDEWQHAEAKIKKLEAELDALRAYLTSQT